MAQLQREIMTSDPSVSSQEFSPKFAPILLFLHSRALEQSVRLLSFLAICAAALFCVLHTARWPIEGDSTAMHYGVFLFSLGKVPYAQYVEPDLPGAYLQEALAMRVFGTGDFSWHIYDLALLCIVIVVCILLAKTYDWVAGLFAGVLFSVIHLSYGPTDAGQREEVMTLCLLLATLIVFHVNRSINRSRSGWWMLPFGLLVGWTTSIKPTAVLFGGLLLLALILARRRESTAWMHYCWLAVAGFVAALLPTVWFLWHYRAFHAFLLITNLLLPFYAKIAVAPLSVLLKRIPPPVILAFLFGGSLAWLQRRSSWVENWERLVLLSGIVWGVISYLSQRKDFVAHRYGFIAFTLLFFFLETFKALQKTSLLRGLSVVAVLYGTVVISWYCFVVSEQRPFDSTPPALVADLKQLGVQNLRGLQCFGLVYLCPAAMNRLGVAHDFTLGNDFVVFPPEGHAALPYYQHLTWDELHRNPPTVIVLTNEQISHFPGFDKLDRWPEFAAYLQSNFRVQTTRMWGPMGYRIYIRDAALAGDLTAIPQSSREVP